MSRPDPPVTLFAGPGSRRLEGVALAAAARLLCRHGHALPDDACSDCRRTLARDHPDLIVAAPEVSRQANVPRYDEPSESKETTIPTALVRAIAADASRSPYEGSRRVVAFLDVEKTDAAAFSALLKVLEEPPLRTTFLLTSTRPRLLPSTILSRVTLRSLPGTSRHETAEILVGRGLTPGEAAARAAFVPEDVDEAAALDLASARRLRDAVLEAASGLLLARSVSWAMALGALLAGEGSKETVERLGLLAVLLRDAVAAADDPSGAGVIHWERARDLASLGAVDARELLSAAAAALELASNLQDGRWNTRLATEAFALGLV